MIRRLTDRIWLIEGGKGGRYPYSHSLYIRDGGGLLVDCGSDFQDILRLRREEGLSAVLMTHYHEDHFLFLHLLPDLPVWVSAPDAPALASLEDLLARYGDRPGGIEEFRRSARALAAIGAPRNVVSHEEPVHAGPIGARMEAYLSAIDRREETLRGFLREPRTRREIIARRIVYGPERTGPWFDYGEWALLSKHLDGMIASGEAIREGDRYVLRG